MFNDQTYRKSTLLKMCLRTHSEGIKTAGASAAGAESVPRRGRICPPVVSRIRPLCGVVLLALLSFAPACTKAESQSVQDIPVAFSTYAQRSVTKADGSFVAPGGDFVAGAQIGVFGFYHNDSNWSTDAENIPDFMYNQLVTKQDDGSWTYSPVKYWPNETGASATSTNIDRLSFWGYYPHIEASAYSDTDAELRFWKADGNYSTAYSNAIAGLPSVTFTQSSDVTKQVDLMFTALEPTKDLTKPGINDKVTLKFYHALALVDFVLTEGTGATVNNLKLTNILKTGTCADPTSRAWTDQEDAFVIEQNNVNAQSNVVLRLLAIPQKIDAEATFTLNYDFTFDSSDPTHPDPIVYKGDAFSVKLYKNTGPVAEQYGVTAWEAGKHYVYKIKAGLERIEFEEIVVAGDDWNIGDDNILIQD